VSPRLAGEVPIRAPVNPPPRRSRTPPSRTTTGLFAAAAAAVAVAAPAVSRRATTTVYSHLLHPPRAFDGRIAATDVKSIPLQPAGHFRLVTSEAPTTDNAFRPEELQA
jgi:hypothetical protein